MKTTKHSYRRYLAFLIAFVLVLSNPGLPAYAEDSISVSDNTDEVLVEEALSSDAADPAREEEIPLGDNDVPIEEGQEELFSDETSDAETTLQDESLTEGELSDDGVEDSFTSGVEASFQDGTVQDETVPEEAGMDEPVDELPEFAVSRESAAGMVTDDQQITTWAELQAALDQGGEVTLEKSLTAEPDDSALYIPGGRNITIDLNGFTLDRGLADQTAEENGNVLEVQEGASLTLKDSQGGGTITGGNTSGNGGGINNLGTLTIENITVTGNKSVLNGGGIYSGRLATVTINGGAITNNVTDSQGGGIYSFGTLNLYGGSITGNTANGSGSQGGGILSNPHGGNLNISGSPVVRDNTAAVGSNIYLTGRMTMIVTGELTDGAELHVTSEEEAAFITTEYAIYNTTQHPNAFFYADDPGKDILQRNGEAYIGEALKDIPYISYAWSGGQLTGTEMTTDGTWMAWPEGTDIPGGQYVVDRDVTVDSRVLLQGDTSIILVNGKTLNVKGLYIPADSKLTVYGQSGDTGKLVSTPTGGAAIGGYSGHDSGQIVIHGGTIDATGYNNCAGIGSNDGQKTGWITILGGTVTATGGNNGAGIGTGRDAADNRLRVIIYGGNVTATGGNNSAGIGGGQDSHGGTILIYGGEITAEGRNSAAGIGGGDPDGSDATNAAVMIYGGTVTATGDDKGAGIGGGEYGSGSIVISGGTVTANGGNEGGAGIGSGKDGTASSVTISGGNVTAGVTGTNAVGMGDRNNTSAMTFSYTDETGDAIRITSPSYGGTVTLRNYFTTSDASALFATGEYTDTSDMAGKTLIKLASAQVDYLDLTDETGTANCIIVTEQLKTWNQEWYAITKDVGISDEITVTGSVNLILADGCKLTARNIKVPEGSSFTIWGQTNGSGKLVADASGQPAWYNIAGIGGSNSGCGDITINGGTVQATGGSDATIGDSAEKEGSAGIGGAYNQSPGTIVINRGTVTATGGRRSAGIGGGHSQKSAGSVTINGGTVTATGTIGGAGIGSGYGALDTLSVLITGGTVTAYANNEQIGSYLGYDAAGIGGGYGSPCDVTITGGTVNASSSIRGAGIGSGTDVFKSRGRITITGGNITANCPSERAAAIGGGYLHNNAAKTTGIVSIEISGGNVTATGGYAGIGGDDCDTKLTWTAASMDSMTVRADTYAGTVTLVKNFRDQSDEDTVFSAGTLSSTVPLHRKTLIPDLSMTHTVTFDSNGGSAIEAQSVPNSGKAVRPADPTKDRFDFADWYEVIKTSPETLAEEAFDFDVPINGSLTLKARWEEKDRNVYYVDASGAQQGPVTDYTLVEQTPAATVWNNGWYVVKEDIEITDRVTVTGNVDLVLYDGVTLTVKDGITVEDGNSLTIWAQSVGKNKGELMANCSDQFGSSGIGGLNGSTGTILINGGDIKVWGGTNAAAIGGSSGKSGGTITIAGGSVLAVGKTINGTGIGAGIGEEIGAAIRLTHSNPSMEVNSSGYNGTVQVEKSFTNLLNNTTLSPSTYASPGKSDLVPANSYGITRTFSNYGMIQVDRERAYPGDTVTLTAEPADGYVFAGWSVIRDDSQEEITVTGDTFIMPASNVTLKAAWEEAAEEVVIIKSANVEFQGQIRLQFTFTFPADVLSGENAYVTFEKAGTTTKKPVSEGTASGEDVSFMISVPAPEYADDITIKVYDGEDSQLTLKSAGGTDYTEDGFVYSVKTYAQKMSQQGSTEQMRGLAKALDDYGTAAQIYFTYGDYSGLPVDSEVTAVTLDDLAPYAPTTSGTKPAGVTGAGIMVEFESDNTLRITFKTDGSKPLSDYTFLLDDVETTPIKSGKNAYLQVVNIAAPNLDTVHTFTVSDGTDTYTIMASALSYAYTSIKNGNAERQNLGKALYLYNQTANVYFVN